MFVVGWDWEVWIIIFRVLCEVLFEVVVCVGWVGLGGVGCVGVVLLVEVVGCGEGVRGGVVGLCSWFGL